MNTVTGPPEARLRQLGLVLPAPPAPVALYDPAVLSGPWLWVSGQIPVTEGKLRFAGKVGADLSEEDGASAARLCTLNGLAHARGVLGTLDRVRRCVQLTVYVNSADGFTGQSMVANGASACLVDIFGESGRHSRVALGAAELPLNAAVEVALVFEIDADELPCP